MELTVNPAGLAAGIPLKVHNWRYIESFPFRRRRAV